MGPSPAGDAEAPPPAARQAPGLSRRRLLRTKRPGWVLEGKHIVIGALVVVLGIGGGRKLLQARRARRAVEALDDPKVSPGAIESVANHGRAGIMELFRLLGTAADPAQRTAAGRALATLWAEDQLVPEEEKAIVTRGFEVTWRARKRYPRGLTRPVPIVVEYGVPFLSDDGRGVKPEQLEWSHRIGGAERAALEKPSDWKPGSGRAEFLLDPADFSGDGPHRLVLQARVRTAGLTSSWELELPHVAFNIEFDRHLAPEALLTLPDDSRGEAMQSAVHLEPMTGDDPNRFLSLNGQFVVRDPPVIRVAGGLPCDLAHHVAIELEGIPSSFSAGDVICIAGSAPARTFSLRPVSGMLPDAIDHPGDYRLRVILTADPNLGWSNPDVRSIWPGMITTDWVTVRVIRW